ncbi:hypothetical protein AURDEDRAFT_168632 [Auricularia subglabra TFB-10046 SS5]|nr:hypothetical protein AURDEDRAFT_168632 [Auricularia subglabra TFB-10046 SS5]
MARRTQYERKGRASSHSPTWNGIRGAKGARDTAQSSPIASVVELEHAQAGTELKKAARALRALGPTVAEGNARCGQINGIKIGKGKHMLLEQGNELTLGVSIEGAVEEYRYMYRHLGNPNPPSSIFDQYQLSSDDP